MKRIGYLIPLLLVLSLLFISVGTTPAHADPGWYNASWLFRKPITITGSSSAQTDYQVKVTVSFVTGHMKSDFSDIRFTAADETTILSHWKESYTASSTADFWVKVPSIPTGGTTIYMYYGNSGASSTDNGTATFAFFDDFTGTSLDTEKWNAWDATVSVSSSVLTITNTAAWGGVSSKTTYAIPYRFIVKAQKTTTTGLGQVGLETGNNWTEAIFGSSYSQIYSTRKSTSTAQEDTVGTWALSTWYRYGIRAKSDNVTYYRDNQFQCSVTNTSKIPTAVMNVLLASSAAGDVLKVDYVCIGKYVFPEPTSSVGNEEALDTTPPTFSIQYYSDSGLTTSMGNNPKLKAGTYYLKITANEALSAAPTISINAEGSANDVTSAATTLVSGNDYKYTRTISSDAAAVGAVLEDISISGTDLSGNPATNVNPTNEPTKAAYTDTTAPTVTINQKAGQADPTNSSPINFTVVFSESVSGFATGNVTLTGTAGATTGTVSGGGTTYEVAVSGMTTNGTVIASIGAGVANDAAGNPNTASTSTDNSVTYDATPPTVATNVQSTSHTAGVWSNNNTVTVNWTAATDNTSGLDGYSIEWSTSPTTLPDTTKDIEEGVTTATSSALIDGNSHYFHIRSKDNAGNWQSGAAHLGPFWIDATPPTITYNYPTAGGQTGWYSADPGNVIDIDFGWVANSPLAYAQWRIGSGGWNYIFNTPQPSNYTDNWGITWASLAEGNNQISIKVADNATNVVTHSYVLNTSGFLFRKSTLVPTITSVSPNAGPTGGGTTITITGTNLAGVSAVTIGGTSASFSVIDASHISATTPAGTAGAKDVTVTASASPATLAGGFTYAAVPTIVSVSPAYGSVAGGTTITIAGANFYSANTTVTIDSANATSVVVVNATTITAVTPASATTGDKTVTVTTPGGSDSTKTFTYVLEAPTVTSVSPNSGSTDGGTTITITGTNFISGATVTIGGNPATSANVTSYTTITAVTPPGTAGSANVTVTTDGGSATLAGGFTYTEAPTVNNLGPTGYINGSFISNTTPTLQFTLSDPNASDNVNYQIQIANTADFSSPIVNYTSALRAQGTDNFTVGQAAGGGSYTTGSQGQTLTTTGDYYWRVRSTDNNDNTGEWTAANGGNVAFRIDQNSSTTPTGSGNVTITNTNAATSVTKSGSGTPTITISRYASNPGGSAPSGFSCGGSHIDVHADNVTGIDEIQITHYYTDAEISGLVESTLKMYYQSGTTWLPCSDTGVDTAAVTVNSTAYSGYVWANIRSDTTPNLDYLLSSSFCGIGQVISGGSGTPPGGGGGGGGGSKPPPPPLTLNQLTTTASLTLDASGIINTTARLKTPSGEASLYIAKGTKLLNSAGQPLTSLSASVVTSPPAPPSGRTIVSAYNFGADGATFTPAITLTMSYDPATLPEGASETELYIAYWDGSQWVALDTTVDTNAHTLSAVVSHFTLFAILAQLPSIPEAYFEVSNLNINPSQVGIGEEIIISAQVANTGGMSGEYTLTMNVEGLPEASQMVELASGQSQGVSFTLTPDNPGSYQVEIGGLQGSFVVLAPSLLEGEVGGVKWSLWLILLITAMVLAALAFIVIRKRQQLAPVVTGEKPPKPLAEERPAPGPSRLGKIMAAIATLVRERLQPTTKAEEPVPTMVKEPLEPTPTVVDIFTVDASAGAGGSISPSGMVMVNLGNAQSFTITPDTGYHVADVLVNGASVGAVTSYTFANVTADHTISASFAIDTFIVNAEVSGNYGSVSPSTQTVDFGTSAVITITPDNARCHIATITDNGSSVSIANPYIVPNVTADHTVVVTFVTDIKNLKIIPRQVKPGGVVNVFAEVTNNDPTTTTFSLVLKVRGIVEAVKEITLEPGQSQKVAFVTLRNKPGVYEVELEGLKGSFTVGNNLAANNTTTTRVVEEPLEPTPEVSLAAMKNLKIIPRQVKPGEIVNIFAEVTNDDPTTTTFSLVLKVRGIVEAVKEITLEPGQSQKVAFVTLRNKPGVYEVELEGLKGSFTVEK